MNCVQMLPPLPIEELRFWLSFPHSFKLQVCNPDSRMGTTQESPELFYTDPLSSLLSRFLQEEIQ